jgi:hypothetical protein
MLLLLPAAGTARRLVVPWAQRADIAGAAVLVLRQHAPGDQVIANNWAAQYYFRNLPATCEFCDAESVDPGRPLWVVVAGPPQERHILADAMAHGRRPGVYHEFYGTTLCRFAPVGVHPR